MNAATAKRCFARRQHNTEQIFRKEFTIRKVLYQQRTSKVFSDTATDRSRIYRTGFTAFRDSVFPSVLLSQNPFHPIMEKHELAKPFLIEFPRSNRSANDRRGAEPYCYVDRQMPWRLVSI